MQNTPPTIEELRAKPRRELEAIFRNAVAIAADPTLTAQERSTAMRAVETIRRVLSPGFNR